MTTHDERVRTSGDAGNHIGALDLRFYPSFSVVDHVGLRRLVNMEHVFLAGLGAAAL